MKSTASAHWAGGLVDGSGTVSAGNGAFTDTGISFKKRFEGASGPGTTPEELIAAAHAGCFSMALSYALGQAGFTATAIDTTAVVTVEPKNGVPTITSSKLTLKASIPNIDEAKFQEIAAGAKAGCVVSRVLTTDISLEASLV